MAETESTTNLTYEKLFEILRAEKSNLTLQKLSETFFEDVAIYVESKLELIRKNRSSDNVFAEKELEETSKQLANAKKIVKMIYDLREKKVVTMALNKSRTASSLIDTSGLHLKETAIFRDMVELLDTYRKGLLNNLLDGKQVVETTPKAKKEKVPSVPKKKTDGMQLVRFIDDVEEFVDPQMNKYGPFREEDISNLPVEVTDMLLKKNKIQYLDSE
jgi:DNA replication initiation complex subunit (GINS family)